MIKLVFGENGSGMRRVVSITDIDGAFGFKGVNFSAIHGEGDTYEEAFEDYKEQFEELMKGLREFEKILFGKPFCQMSPIRVFFHIDGDCERLFKNFTVEQVYNDDRIIQLTDNPLRPGLLETLKMEGNYAECKCEMSRCKHNSGKGKCQLEYICASLVDGKVLCMSKEMSE